MLTGCLLSSLASAGDLADIISYCEIGQNPTGGIAWMYPDNVLVKEGGISLGNWNDQVGLSSVIESMTGYNMDQGNPTGLVVGFSAAVNNGNGNDLLIMGNVLQDESDYNWAEPGYIEVAMETTITGQNGATANGWQDETFYLIKPGNYDIVGDPRNGPLNGIYTYIDDPSGEVDENGDPIQIPTYPGSWGEDIIAAGGNHEDLYGYADWNPSGDRVDIDDAIDMDGNYVSLDNIAYVRIRTASNDDAGAFGTMSTEVLYVENISLIPEPATITLSLLAVAAISRRSIKRKH